MNFEFLKNKSLFKQLDSFCSDAETFVISHPDLSATSSRKALEAIVKYFYAAKYPKRLDIGTTALFKLVTSSDFTAYMDDSILTNIHYIRSIGNNATHGELITRQEAMTSLESLYYVVTEIFKLFKIQNVFPSFDKTVYSKTDKLPLTTKIIDQTNVDVNNNDFEQFSEGLQENIVARSAMDLSEAETRKLYIDNALKEAGWKVSSQDGAIIPSCACVEIELQGMPNNAGIGYADYILFDDDSMPLAVIEAKKTSVDENVGAQQAKLYADCIEKKWGRRPIIFYTNGYNIKIVANGYPARKVYGYYTKDELHSLIIRRSLSKITETRIDPKISDRYYIQEAATNVCETFNNNHRKSLIVMATGTGKTRCAVSIVDLLQKCNWVKHVLFLADRVELVKQAKNAFVTYLPNSSVCAISEENDEKDYDARVIVSTYPSMMNLIDCEDKKFGVAKFDLIIIDECHRSVYNKYKAIFNYFDSLLLGLTATPRERVDSSTYDLFELPKGEPTYSYDYRKAVEEGFLVDYLLLNKTTQILKDGLTYKNLSKEEQEEYETLFADENGNFPAQIDAAKFYKEIINENTVDTVLQTLMNEGLKVDSGDKLGKTIIFAQNHKHAEVIVDRFNKLYPEYGNDFCRLIDYSVKYVGTVINDFKVKDKEPVIAVSVDMLDTGIDIPEIVNLVFFKRVFSPIKFWQMIGRGTRLCKDLNVQSPSKEFFNFEDLSDGTRKDFDDKQGFFIFDFCGNFDFFDIHPKGKEDILATSLSQKIYEIKVDLVAELQKNEHQSNEEHKKYYDKWKKDVINEVKNFKRYLINVKTNLKYVDKYSEDSSWDYISLYDVKEIKKYIAPLVAPIDDDEKAKSFDLFLLNMELEEIIGEKDYSKAIQKVTSICYVLLDKTTIPMVNAKKDLLNEFVSTTYWSNISVDKLEKVRTELRDLIQFISKKYKIIKSDFKDDLVNKSGPYLTPQFKDYRQTVTEYLIENFDTPVIRKIRNLEQINEKDIKELEKVLWKELGSEDDFKTISKGESLTSFVRKIVGIDREVVNALFAEYLSKYNYSSAQEEFLHMIVNYVRENGDIKSSDLLKEPFAHIDYTDLFAGMTEGIYSFIDSLHKPIQVATAS